jgi:hypothetical protein
MESSGAYTTKLGAGLGLGPETSVLLGLWVPGMGTGDLYRKALQSGLFPNLSARRLKNIVKDAFAPRYLAPMGQPARYLQALEPALPKGEFQQLLYLYTCRANPILADFVREVYWERYAAGEDRLRNEDVEAFMRRGSDEGKTVKRWSDATIKRVVSYLTGVCADFGLLGRRYVGGRLVRPYRVEDRVAAFLAHDLHFAGLGDHALQAHGDWALFGLGSEDVRDELKRLSLQGYFVYQSAGTVTHISWKSKSMEEFVRVLAEG